MNFKYTLDELDIMLKEVNHQVSINAVDLQLALTTYAENAPINRDHQLTKARLRQLALNDFILSTDILLQYIFLGKCLKLKHLNPQKNKLISRLYKQYIIVDFVILKDGDFKDIGFMVSKLIDSEKYFVTYKGVISEFNSYEEFSKFFRITAEALE